MSKEIPNTPQISENAKLSIPRPNIILTDVYGVITSSNFKRQLNDYVINNLKEYLKTNFKEKLVVLIITKLREDSAIEIDAGIHLPLIESPNKTKDEIVNSAVANILWRIQRNYKSSNSKYPLAQLLDLIWNDGYITSKLKVHVFSDVKKNLDHWRYHQFVKIYGYASGPANGQKLFMRSTVEGDLNTYFANYIKASSGAKYIADKYVVVTNLLREPNPQNILYLTDEPKKARAAIGAGLRAVVVIRPANPVYNAKDLENLMTIQSFDDLVLDESQANPVPCC